MKKIFLIFSLICLTMFVGCSNTANLDTPTVSRVSEDVYSGTLSAGDNSSIQAEATMKPNGDTIDFYVTVAGSTTKLDAGGTASGHSIAEFKNGEISINGFPYGGKEYSGTLTKQ